MSNEEHSHMPVFLAGMAIGAVLIGFTVDAAIPAKKETAYNIGFCEGRGGVPVIDGGCVHPSLFESPDAGPTKDKP